MAVGVVHALEAVEIQAKQTDRVYLRSGVLQSRAEHFAQVRSVREPGEAAVPGLVL